MDVCGKLFPMLQRFQLRRKSQNVDWGSTLHHYMIHDLVLAVLLSHPLSQLPKVNLKTHFFFFLVSKTSFQVSKYGLAKSRLWGLCPHRGSAKAPKIIPVRVWGQREPIVCPCLFSAVSCFHIC